MSPPDDAAAPDGEAARPPGAEAASKVEFEARHAVSDVLHFMASSADAAAVTAARLLNECEMLAGLALLFLEGDADAEDVAAAARMLDRLPPLGPAP